MTSEVPHRGVAPPNDSFSAVKVAFPRTPDDFENDPRVSFSKLTSKWILENDDGSEWEYDEARQKWMPSLDEALIKEQRKAYGGGDDDEDESARPDKKRKGSDEEQDNEPPAAKRKKQKASKREQKEPPKNTAVYATSLPLDTSVAEIKDVFSRYGVIAEEIDSGKPRIKLYEDDNGKLKGDALIVYFRPESVNLAVQMLDDSDFRPGEEGPFGRMRVSEADRNYKKQKDRPEEAVAAQKTEGEVTRKKQQSRDKQKIIKKTQKLNNKLADWSDDEVSALPDTSSRFDKVVILKHMFTQKEIEEDPAAILDIKEDVREECAKLGEVTSVQLFDKEADGVLSVRFGVAEAAKACVRMMDGRMFSGQRVEAYISDGNEKFKKSSAKKAAIDEGEENEEDERMDKFGEYLEGRGS